MNDINSQFQETTLVTKQILHLTYTFLKEISKKMIVTLKFIYSEKTAKIFQLFLNVKWDLEISSYYCVHLRVYEHVKFELNRYFLTRNFFFSGSAMICWLLKSKTVQKLSNTYHFLSGNLKILFRFNFDQIFILFSGCARNTWWAGSSDPKQYRSCWIYRWSIDDRWGWWWKQHPNLNRWSHVHDWKDIVMGIFYKYLNFPCSLTLSSGPKIVLLY